jgi:hypothetical protein
MFQRQDGPETGTGHLRPTVNPECGRALAFITRVNAAPPSGPGKSQPTREPLTLRPISQICAECAWPLR